MDARLRPIFDRSLPPEPWSTSAKIPWHEPGFSERMLAEHLSQAHDAASRRLPTIDAQVEWIDRELLASIPANVLDLGCGPGFYAHRLAHRGHTVHGIDFSPASIRHARAEAANATPSFTLADIRSADFGDTYDCVLLVYGELNTFSRGDTLTILSKVHRSLREGGTLLLELHTYSGLESSDDPSSSWRTLEHGLFSDRPHLLLEESFWDADCLVRMHRWFVVDVATGEVHEHMESLQAYSDPGYRELLLEAGFRDVESRARWPVAEGQQGTLFALTART